MMEESSFGVSLAIHRVILGSWDANTNTPDVNDLPFVVRNGQKYYVSVTGTRDIGNGVQTYNATDFITWYDTTGWIKDDQTPKASETANDSTVAGASVANALETLDTEIGGVATDLSNHIADVDNPHDTDLGNLNNGTLVELNALLTNLIATYGGLRDIGIGLLSERPVASTANRFWWSTDGGRLYRDNGSSWQDLSALPVLVNQTNVVYVSNVGNDANNGLTSESAKLTITSALTQATALLPTINSQIRIEILDGGKYTGNITCVPFVHIIGNGSTIEGNITMSSTSHIDVARIVGNATFSSTGESYISADYMSGQITNSSSGKIIAEIGVLDNAGSVCVKNTSTGIIYIDCEYLNCGTRGIWVEAGEVHVDVGHISESAPSIALDVDGGKITGIVGKIATTTAYDIEVGGQVHLFLTELTGTELNDGTGYILKASDRQFLNDATDTTRGLMGIIAQTFAGLKTFNTPIRMPTLNTDNLLKGSAPNGDMVNSGISANTIAEEGSFINMQPFTSAPIVPTNGDFWFRKSGSQRFLEYHEGGVTYSVELGSI